MHYYHQQLMEALRSASPVSSTSSNDSESNSSSLRGVDVSALNLALLPQDIIEEIADRLRYPILRTREHNELLLNEGFTNFAAARFHLSAFSRVCSSIRPTVERILYRNIHLDNVGWIHPTRRTWSNGKHYAHPAGSLRLLLRTLDQRPHLARFIKSVDLRWCEDDIYDSESYLETRRFLSLCSRLHRLSIDSLSWKFIDKVLMASPDSPTELRLGISSFSASCESRYMEILPTLFPRLRDLQVHLYGKGAPSRESELPITPNLYSSFNRKLQRLRVKLHVPDTAFESLASRVLFLASTAVEDLYIEGRPTLNIEHAPALPPFQPPICQSIRYLCLKDIDPFHAPSGSSNDVEITDRYGCSEVPLACMPSLMHLHLVRPRPLDRNAFRLLPYGVKSVSFSSYGIDSTKSSKDSKSDFVASVVESLNYLAEFSDSIRTKDASKACHLRSVKTYGAIPGDPWDLGDLRPLAVHCASVEVPFIEIGAAAQWCNSGIEPELILFFSS